MIKVEFRRRLERLHDAISGALYYDSVERGLMPALFSVFSYLWTGRNAVSLSKKSRP